jgi:hypothetical protein
MINSALGESKVDSTHDNGNCKDVHTSNLVLIDEKVNLTKSQYEVLKTICNTYEQSISEYMHEALTEAMKFDITEGNFSDVLLGKLDEDHEKTDSSLPI